MNGDCDKMKDRVADLMSGILPESQTRELRQHLGKCSACKGYAKALQEEDQLLAGLFAKLDASMKGREEEIINTISRLDKSGQSNIISVWRMTVKTLLERHAAAAGSRGRWSRPKNECLIAGATWRPASSQRLCLFAFAR